MADRWRLLANAQAALVQVVEIHHREIRHLARQQAVSPPQASALPETTIDRPIAHTPNKARRLSQEARLGRIARYELVMELHRQGKSQREISRQLRMSPRIVAKHLRAGDFTERAQRVYHNRIDARLAQVRQWWDAGDHAARSLYRRLVREGFDGSFDSVRRHVAAWRTPQERERLSGPKPTIPPRPSLATPSANRLSWLMIDETIVRSQSEATLLKNVLDTSEAIRNASESVLAFGRAVRQKDVVQLEAWKAHAAAPQMPATIRSFAAGIERDWNEVRAAVESHYSNGRAEGHVNRLKLIKRKMYGRAKFDLLRIRVLASGP